MGNIVAIIALSLWCVLCIVLTAVRLPGPWLILLAAVVYAWWRSWEPLGPWMLGGLFAMAVCGEILEFAASALTARRAGASKQAIWGALIGSILGAVFLSFVLPIPLIGTVAGALVGCFLGAVLAEIATHQDLDRGARVGVSSTIGFGLGMIGKVTLAVAMSGMVLVQAVRNRELGVTETSAVPSISQTEDDHGASVNGVRVPPESEGDSE